MELKEKLALVALEQDVELVEDWQGVDPVLPLIWLAAEESANCILQFSGTSAPYVFNVSHGRLTSYKRAEGTCLESVLAEVLLAYFAESAVEPRTQIQSESHPSQTELYELVKSEGLVCPPTWKGVDSIRPLLEKIRSEGGNFFIKWDGERDSNHHTVDVRGGRVSEDDWRREETNTVEKGLSKVLLDYFQLDRP